MKKIFTLMTAVLLFVTAFAQNNPGRQRGNDKDFAYNDNRGKNDNDRRNDRYVYNTRERDRQIALVNREYDRKIEAVKRKWFMNHNKKERMIWSLEDQRRHDIRMLYAKYDHSYNHFDNNNSRKH